MKDEAFIGDMLQRGHQAREKVKAAFSDLSLAQLSWKPAEEKWSIGQCLDHLIVSDCLYFPSLKKISESKFDMSFWENRNPFSGFFGKMLISQVQEIPGKKLNAPKIFSPYQTKIDAVILERFHKHLDSLLGYIAACSRVDIDKMHITSPVSKLVTFSLRNLITILIQHEHRHINQAIRVMQAKDFPEQ